MTEDVQIGQCSDKAEANSRRAAEETARANDLARQLDEERRKSAGTRMNSPAFAGRQEQRQAAAERRFGAATIRIKSGPTMLWRAITLMASDRRHLDTDQNPAGQPAAALVRPREIKIATKAGRLAWKCASPFIERHTRAPWSHGNG